MRKPRPTISKRSCTRAETLAQLARSSSDGTTAAEGGDLGTYKRGQLAQVFEDATFPLKAGEFTEPIRTKQGFVILKVVEHTPGGIPAFKDVEQDVEQNYYMSRMEPAMRDYLTQDARRCIDRDQAGIRGYGCEPEQADLPDRVLGLYSAFAEEEEEGGAHSVPRDDAYLPAEIEAGGSRGSSRSGFGTPPPSRKEKGSEGRAGSAEARQEREDSFWQGAAQDVALTPSSQTEDAGAGVEATSSSGQRTGKSAGGHAAGAEAKTRFSDRAKQPKHPKKTVQQQRTR